MKKSLFFVAMMIGVSSFAQTTYTLSTHTSAYTELTNATPVNMFDDYEEEYWDDPLFFIPLEFGFEVGDSTYNSLIQFGGGAEIMIGNLDYADTLLTSTSIHLFGLIDDLADAAAIEGLSHSEITYATIGDAGNRITKIQYKDAAFYEEVYGSEPAADNRMNFQLWFYEDNGILEVHFGESNVPDPELVFYDNPGPGIVILTDGDLDSGDMNWAAIVIGDPVNPTLHQFNYEEDDEQSLNTIPENGQVYRLTPSVIVGLENASAPEFSLYPTLAQNEIWVKDAGNPNPTYRIMDITGKQVKAGSLRDDSPVNISNLNAGVYIISIDGMTNAVKFVKE